MSSKKNKKIRLRLEQVYGKGCMFKKARIAERIEAMGGIKTYRQFIEERHFTLKEIRRLESNMTLHHLKHVSEGGATSEYNSAVINELAHRYEHSLPRHHEEIINNMLRDYKGKTYQKCTVELVDELDTGIEVKFTDFDIPDIPVREKKKFNRAKEKEKFRRRIEEDYDLCL